MTTQTPPRWDLTNVYPSLSSKEYSADFEKLNTLLMEMEILIKEKTAKVTGANEAAGLALDFVERYNAVLLVAGTLRSYIESFVSTDSYNKEALRKESEFDQVAMKISQLETQLLAWIGKVADRLPEMFKAAPALEAHRYFLEESARQSRYLMSEPEEMLAAELSLSGSTAWSKLQGMLTSQASAEVEVDGEIKKLPSPALINLRSHPDGETRKRGYDAENELWTSLKVPLAAALNGIKGEVNVLNRRRGREDAVHSAIDAAHIDRQSLEAMLGAMHDSFPMFRRYFKAKAKYLGKEKLPWWDLFAPVGEIKSDYTFEEAKEVILTNFGRFAPELEGFAGNAFKHHWIDTEQRDGKRGGAFCMDVPGVGESRILCNFDGSFDQVSTMAHELGHGFHNDCAVKAGKTEIQKFTPMTLAETASIMCETIVTSALMKEVTNPQQELAILESQLNGDSQVIVDIYSRYLFEKEVFEKRETAELNADEICEIMENAQKATYGDGLDERYLQKWMWTWKPHYFYAGLSFYNFPYAFGLLFATGLYAIYQQRGASFVPDYINLLASTGEAPAADLAARFGIDIRTRKFWEDSLKVCEKRVERYCELVS
ncbi:MAG TPA: M3 family oligoendopeptidase [Anaerolineaceae bacterium]|nr:M3 family oligoendopeptidase [Anaerolineaceae bacterium]